MTDLTLYLVYTDTDMVCGLLALEVHLGGAAVDVGDVVVDGAEEGDVGADLAYIGQHMGTLQENQGQTEQGEVTRNLKEAVINR